MNDNEMKPNKEDLEVEETSPLRDKLTSVISENVYRVNYIFIMEKEELENSLQSYLEGPGVM